MKVTLNQESRPYEQTRSRISILVSTFNKYILANHQPSDDQYQQIMKQWRVFETKQLSRSPIPNDKKLIRCQSQEKNTTQVVYNVQVMKNKAREIMRNNVAMIGRHNRDVFGI